LVCKALFVFENNGAQNAGGLRVASVRRADAVPFETAGRFAHQRREGIEAT
jgi:hypothetical protein